MEKLKEYVEKTRNAGYTDEQIIDSLKKAGWSKSDIDRAMDMLKHDMPVAPKKDSAAAEKKTNTLAVIALICAFIIPFLAIILGIIALGEIKKRNEKGKGLAIAAIILGMIPIILIIIYVFFIMGMAYFGVMDPSRMLPERCQFPAGMDCIDKASVTTDTITIALRNNIGFPIMIQDITSPDCSGSQIGIGSSYEDLAEQEVENNAVFRIRLTGCSNGRSGSDVDTTITVDYENIETGIINQAVGDIRGKVS